MMGMMIVVMMSVRVRMIIILVLIMVMIIILVIILVIIRILISKPVILITLLIITILIIITILLTIITILLILITQQTTTTQQTITTNNNNNNTNTTNKNDFIPNFMYLNNKCGADYIVTNRREPENITVPLSHLKRVAVFDGDADRIIYFSTSNNRFSLLDGDRIAVLLANYIYELTKDIKNITVGAVLSHYSNSGAVNYLREKMRVVLSNTGVKNFVKHSRQFDIGIFFEPNGHGSVTFSEKITKEQDNRALKSLCKIFDPCVGDAMSTFLVVEAISQENTFEKTMKLYETMPTRMMSVKIKERNSIVMNGDVEIESPKELRDKVKYLAGKFRGGRAFVRPSGTEDVVRVFAECAKREEADLLCVSVSQAVYDICGGIGYHPEIEY